MLNLGAKKNLDTFMDIGLKVHTKLFLCKTVLLLGLLIAWNTIRTIVEGVISGGKC